MTVENLMGYYMRFVITDNNDVSLNILENALKQVDPRYSIPRSKGEYGEVIYENERYGAIEINSSGDDFFNSELEELVEEVEETEAGAKETVLHNLKTAQSIIAVQVLWGNRKAEETLDKLGPLWKWLFANRKGLLQTDGEGYYDKEILILKIE